MSSSILERTRERDDPTVMVPAVGPSTAVVTDKLPLPPPPPEPARARSMRLMVLTGALAATLGGTVIGGWFTQSEALVKVLPRWPEMQFSSAVAMALLGLALMAAPLGRRGAVFAGVLGILVTLGGALALLEYVINVNLGVGFWLAKYLGPDSPLTPGRMSSNTAACWIVAGGALALSFLPARRVRPGVLASAAAVLAGLNIVVVTGLLLDLQPGYGWSSVTPTGLTVSVGLVVGAVGLGAAAMRWSQHRRPLPPQWLPIPVALFVFVISVAISQVAYLLESGRIETSVQTSARGMADTVQRDLRGRVATARRIAARWETRQGATRAEWVNDAQLHLADHPDTIAIALMDSSLIAKWMVTREGTDWREGMAFGLDPELAPVFE